MSDQTASMTQRLLCSSVQHLRLTLEPLAIGTICLSANGLIEDVDATAEQIVQFTQSELLEKSFTVLLLDPAFELIEAMRTRRVGYVETNHLRTKDGETIAAEIVLASSLEPHRYVFNIIYAPDF